MTNPDNTPAASPIVITCEPPTNTTRGRAIELVDRLALPMCEPGSVPADVIRLVVTERRLELRGPVGSKEGPVFVDFVGGASRPRRVDQGTRKDMLAKAVGLKGLFKRLHGGATGGLSASAASGSHIDPGRRFEGDPSLVLDATAGFARDAYVIAQLGCRLLAVERSPVVAAMVEDGIARARASGRARVIAALDRITFLCADAKRVLADMPVEQRRADCPPYPSAPNERAVQMPDVVYLDPMYPPSRKSALNRKELRMLRSIVGDDVDASELFALAQQVASKRVVVKRPRHAPPLAPNPDIQYKGSSVRYDVYLTRTPPQGRLRE